MASYSGDHTTFLSRTFELVNDALQSFAQSYSSQIATDIAPIVSGFLVLTFVFMGMMAVYGKLDKPFTEVAWRLIWTSVIISIALTSTMYQSYIIDVFLTLPDDLVASISSSVTSTNNIATGQAAAQAIEQLYDLGTYNAGLFFNEASANPLDLNLAPYLYGSLVYVGTVCCAIMGALWLLIAKVVLALMLGVGPIFICCLIWPATRQYFWSWVGQIINTVLTAVFVLAIFAIFSNIFQLALNALEIGQDQQGFMDAAIFTFLGILSMGVLLCIPRYVEQLTGAAGGAVGTAMAKVTGGAIGGASGAIGGASGAVRGGFASNSASAAYQANRAAGQSRFASARSARHEFNKSMQEMKRGYPDYYRKTHSHTTK